MSILSYDSQFFTWAVLVPMVLSMLILTRICGHTIRTQGIRAAVLISLIFSFVPVHAQSDWTGWPSTTETDGRFIAISGPLSAIRYIAPNIIIGIPSGATQFDIELFDGDASVNLSSKYDINVSTAGYTYTLYQDPERDGTGTQVEFTRAETDFTNDSWSSYVTAHAVNTSAQGFGGFYWYRLALVFNGNPDEEQFFNALKVRVKSDATSPASVGALKEIIIGSSPFNPTLDPGLGTPENTYDGDWLFNIRVPEGVSVPLNFSDSDADFNADATAPGLPPDDNFSRPEFMISPSIRYELFAPNGELITLNTDPSGTNEEETYSYNPGGTTVPAGFYQWHWFGVDAANVLILRTDFEILPISPPPPQPDSCGLTVNKTCLVQAAPVGPFNCKDAKPIDELGMIWNGVNNVRVKAWKGSVGSTLLADIDNIALGDEVVVSGFAGSPNDVFWEIFNAGTNTKIGESKFHMSCSDDDMDGPEDCGAVLGNGKDNASGFVNAWLLELLSGNGETLDCTTDTPASDTPASDNRGLEACEFETSQVPSCETGTPSNLTWQYTGGGCTASDNDQNPGDTSCSGSIDGDLSVIVTDDMGNVFAIDPGDEFTTTRDASTKFTLTNVSGAEVNTLHASCSQPLQAGDMYGSLTLVALDGERAGRAVEYFYEVINTGTHLTDVTLFDNLLGQVGGPIFLAQGETQIFTTTAMIKETTTNIVTVVGNTATQGMKCAATDSTTVTMAPCSLDSNGLVFSGKEIKLKLTNPNIFNTKISRISITWPSENGELREIKRNKDVIHRGYFTPTSVVINSGWEGSDDKRTINAGNTKELKFKFEHDVSLYGEYTITVEFSSGCVVTENYTPPLPPATGSEFACTKPIDSLSMIWEGDVDVTVNAWIGSVGSTLLVSNAPVSVGGELTVSGYAGASTNDVYWEIFNASTGVKMGESKFHLSCSDDNMDGPEDCGKAEGNGKDNNSSMINDWTLEGMIDSETVLDCLIGDPTTLLYPEVETTKLEYIINEAINIEYRNGSSDSKAWIGLFAKGDPDTSYGQWKYTNGLTTGTLSFDGLSAGEYEVRMFQDNGYTRLDKYSFSVAGLYPEVETTKLEYIINEAINIEYRNGSSDSKAWIGLFAKGDPDTSYGQWKYTNGLTTGTLSFDGLSAGEYEVRMFQDNGYTRLDKYSFSVAGR